MKKLISILILAALFTLIQAQEIPAIQVETSKSVLILKVGKDQKLYQCYLGTKLNSNTSYDALSRESAKSFVINDGNPIVNLRHLVYPHFWDRQPV